MRKITASLLFALAFRSVCLAASASWLAIHTEEYSPDKSPSKDTTRYAAYFCTAYEASDMFGGRSSVASITDYLSRNFSSGRAALDENDAEWRSSRPFVQTVDYDTYGGQYEFIDNFASSLTLSAFSDYFAIVLYDDGVNSAVRVFGNADWTDGNITFDDHESGVFSEWTATVVPEPAGGMLLALGLAGLALRRKRPLRRTQSDSIENPV